MGLRNGQTAVSTGILYECARVFESSQDPYIATLFVRGATVDVYGSNSATQPTAISDLVLNIENKGVTGELPFVSVPRYIVITNGSPTEMVTTGLSVRSLGAIS